MAIETVKLHEADEAFYRGSMVAMHQLLAQDVQASPIHQIGRRCTVVATHGCLMAQRQGLLLGDVPAAVLGMQMYSVFSTPWREWIYHRISIAAFQQQFLQGLYMLLCSDASPGFLLTLRSKLRAQQKVSPLPLSKSRSRT